MSHQGQTVPTEPAPHHQDLKVVFDWLLEPADFAAVGFRSTCTWTPRSLTVAPNNFTSLPRVERGRTPLLWLRDPC